LCSPHSLRHLLDLRLRQGQLLCTAGAQPQFAVTFQVLGGRELGLAGGKLIVVPFHVGAK
jgi:hypothetical protein